MLRIIQGDAFTELRKLPSDSVHCCVTSPGYWGLRAYLPEGHPDKHLEHGAEKTPEVWVVRLVEVFREVRRVLHPSGTLWLNVGDAYNSSAHFNGGGPNAIVANTRNVISDKRNGLIDGLKPKDIIGLPWSLAFALRADGWYLRQEIIYAKPNPMPESVTDRCTKAHEQIFLLSKRANYFFDQEAIKEPQSQGTFERFGNGNAPRKTTAKAIDSEPGVVLANSDYKDRTPDAILPGGMRNKRSVWTIPSEPSSEPHYAAFPSALVKPCILAGTSARGVCPLCLEPWVRILEPGTQRSWHDHENDLAEGKGQRKSDTNDFTGDAFYENYVPARTLGWQCGCDCESPDPPIPATVLDPFLGSGTTAAVALELGRSAIGIELSDAYIVLALQKCAKVTPGFPALA